MSEPKKIFAKKYKLIQKLASGGFGTVYLAKNIDTNKLCAIKRLKKEKFSQRNAKDFNKEIDILKKLSDNKNDYTPYLYDSFKYLTITEIKSLPEEERKELLKIKPYISIEYMKKGNLFDYIQESSDGIGEKYSKLLFKKIVKCIEFCHKNDIAHLDIKPKNIVLDEHYNPKITDFGLSEEIKKDALGKIINSKGNKGTPMYKCPEMLEKGQYNCVQADIFCLGVLLCYIVAKKNAFSNSTSQDCNYKYIINKDNDKDNIDKFWEAAKINFVEYSKLSDEFKKLYIKMISYDPDNRPSIENILNDPWLKEINNMKEEELKDYEEKYRKIFEELEINMENNNIIKQENKETINSNQVNKSFECKINLFDINKEIEPNKLNDDEFDNHNNCIIIEGYIKPVEFMNSLAGLINKKYKNCIVDKIGKKLKLIVMIAKEKSENMEENSEGKEKENEKEEEDEEENDNIYKMYIELLEIKKDNRYLVNFIKGDGDIEDHYQLFIEIREIIKNLLI